MYFNGIPIVMATTLFLVGVVILIILYLIKVRRRAVTVPFGGLWSRVLRSEATNAWLQRFKRLWSLVLWVFILLLVILALLDPRPEENNTPGHHIVMIVDTSASMATLEGDRTRLELARSEISERLDSLGPNDRVVLLNASGQIQAASGAFTNDSAILRNALADLSVTATAVNINEAIQTSLDLVRGKDHPEIILYSDGQFKNAPFRGNAELQSVHFEHRLLGTSQGNLSIEGFNVRRYPSNKLDYEVFLQVKNGFQVPVEATLGIYNLVKDGNAEGGFIYKPIEEKSISLDSGASEIRFYADLPLASHHLAARLTLNNSDVVDPLPLDNEAFVLIPEFSKPRILCITPSNLFLEAALLLNENDSVRFMKPDDPALHAEGSSDISIDGLAKDYDIFIFDNSYYEKAEISVSPTVPGNFLFINPVPGKSPFQLTQVDHPMLERVNHKHPVSKMLTLKTLNISKASTFKLQKNDEMVLRAIEGPIIVTRKTDAQKMVAVGFSLVESDIIFRIALPMFIMNSIEWFMGESTATLQAFQTGLPWHIPAPAAYQTVNIVAPDGSVTSKIPQYHGEITYYASQPGFYRVMSVDHPGESFEIAANFVDAVESDLSVPESPMVATTPETEDAPEQTPEKRSGFWYAILSVLPAGVHNLWVAFLLLAAMLLFVEWLTFHRRWTV